MGIFKIKALTRQKARDKRNLVAAIMAAITAYMQMEQQPPFSHS